MAAMLRTLALPEEWLGPCIDAWFRLVAASRRRAYADPGAVAPILVLLVARERGLPLPFPLKRFHVDKKAYLDAVAAAGIRPPPPVSDQNHGDFLAACHATLSRVLCDPADLAALRGVHGAVSPHLAGKTSRTRVAVVCYIAWQRFSPTISFGAMARALDVPAASLKSALESLARSVGVEWRGTRTRFDV